jgi:hypothetical protein
MSFPTLPPSTEELAARLASDKTLALHYSQDAIGNRVAEITSQADVRRMLDQPLDDTAANLKASQDYDTAIENLRRLQRKPESV